MKFAFLREITIALACTCIAVNAAKIHITNASKYEITISLVKTSDRRYDAVSGRTVVAQQDFPDSWARNIVMILPGQTGTDTVSDQLWPGQTVDVWVNRQMKKCVCVIACPTCMGDSKHKRTPECVANHCPYCDGTGQEHTEQKRKFRVYPDATGDYHLRYQQTEQHGGMLYNYSPDYRSKFLNKDVVRLIFEFAGLHPEPQLLRILVYFTLYAPECDRHGVRWCDCAGKDFKRCPHKEYKSRYQGYIDLEKREVEREWERTARRLPLALRLNKAKRAPGDALKALIREIMPCGFQNQK